MRSRCSSSEDAAATGPAYVEGMRRELEEEVIIDTPCRERCVGLINDDHVATYPLPDSGEVELPGIRRS